MKRRLFITAFGGMAMAWPLVARPQQKAMPVIGYLSTFSAPQTLANWAVAFRQGLSETHYVEGQNFKIQYRWAKGHYDRLPALAGDLVRHKVDLIVTFGGTSAALAAKSATSIIPIVFTNVGDPSEADWWPVWLGQAGTSRDLAICLLS